MRTPDTPTVGNAFRPATSALYEAPIERFVEAPDDQVIGALAQPIGLPLTPEQQSAWRSQLPMLRDSLRSQRGWIFLEFVIPRLGRRVDAVVVSPTAVLPIEFKVHATHHDKASVEQAWDYGLDLKNFHEPSHGAPVFPILCATGAAKSDRRWAAPHADGVRPPFRCNAESLSLAIRLAHESMQDSRHAIDPEAWGRGAYSPTPTIIEAARALYARHEVQDISRNDAGAVNLTMTSSRIEAAIAEARSRGRKVIVFVTGVPGAGKTLVGLNVAARHRERDDETHSVFLSGNGPLVAVLREALARDDVQQAKAGGGNRRIGQARNTVKAFIQNVHHFREDTRRNPRPPVDHVVVFDEAQRAWNQQTLSNFMRRRHGVHTFKETEPEYLLGALDRHEDWAAVVCLVGGGQEINTGEAGISAWLDAVTNRFSSWDVHVPRRLESPEFMASAALESLRSAQRLGRVLDEDHLHLATSMRSFRAERVSEFVRELLDGSPGRCAELLSGVRQKFPIAVVRSMREARRWIQRHRRGSERAGLVASSSAQRLKPHAVDVRVRTDPVQWFLNPSSDTRSSQYLEDAATEFQVQGLELDWTIVAWDADLRRMGDGWAYHSFRGEAWTTVQKEERRRYLKNAYRVLLTRARQGMVIFVPPGRRRDSTRRPEFYDGVFQYLRSLGIGDPS